MYVTCLLNINFQSLDGKRASLANRIASTLPDVVIGTETWLTPQITSASCFPDTYTVYRKDRVGKTGGGVLIAVKNNIESVEETDLDTGGDMIWVKIFTKKHRHIYV